MTGNEDKDGEQQEIGEEGGETNRQGEKETGAGDSTTILTLYC